MKKTGLLLGLAAFVLVGCNGTVPDSSTPASSTPADTSSAGSSSSSSSSSGTSVAETYRIVLPSDARYSLSASKSEAASGETITVTATPNAGYRIIDVLVNGTAINKQGDAYVFSMPDHDVRLSATLAVEGDITLGGGVAAVLTKDETTGIYSAKGIQVNSAANFSYFVKDTSLGVESIDRTKCFADISLSGDSRYELQLAGGATYDFYYDPANGARPCYIQRTEVTSLPSSVSSLESLFAGSVQSSPSVYPLGVNKVTYTNTATDEEYEWNKLQGDKTYATVKRLSDKSDLAFVYKQIKDGVYSVADTYTEGNHADGSADPTRAGDVTKFSGRYKISDVDEDRGDATDDLEFDPDRQFVNSNIAAFDLDNYSHDMRSLDFDIMYSYRVAKTIQDEITQASVAIASDKNDDGTFSTSIVSSSTYDSTAVSSNTDVVKYHDEYSVNLTFTSAGSILSGDYLDTHYTEKSYDFTNFKIIGDGIVAKRLAFAYSYGDPSDDLNPFDATPYFVSSLAPVIENKATSQEATINSGDDPSDYLALNIAPATALDGWQYQIQASSDEAVIAYDDVYNKWNARSVGSAELSISNSSTKDIVAKVTVNVAYTKEIRDFNLTLPYGYEGANDDGETANQALVYEKHVRRYQLGAMAYDGSGACAVPADTTLSLSNDTTGLKVSIVASATDPSKKDILFDATNMVAPADGTKITLTVRTSHYASEVTPSVFAVVLLKTDYSRANMVGTWKCSSAHATLTLTDSKVDPSLSYYLANAPYYGYVVVGSTTYEFGYDYVESSFNHDFTVSFKGEKSGDSSTSLVGEMNYAEASGGDPEAIWLGLAKDTMDWSQYEENYEDVLGEYYVDEDGNYFNSYAVFTRSVQA
jgi:hypothetical protein